MTCGTGLLGFWGFFKPALFDYSIYAFFEATHSKMTLGDFTVNLRSPFGTITLSIQALPTSKQLGHKNIDLFSATFTIVSTKIILPNLINGIFDGTIFEVLHHLSLLSLETHYLEHLQ